MCVCRCVCRYVCFLFVGWYYASYHVSDLSLRVDVSAPAIRRAPRSLDRPLTDSYTYLHPHLTIIFNRASTRPSATRCRSGSGWPTPCASTSRTASTSCTRSRRATPRYIFRYVYVYIYGAARQRHQHQHPPTYHPNTTTHNKNRCWPPSTSWGPATSAPPSSTSTPSSGARHAVTMCIDAAKTWDGRRICVYLWMIPTHAWAG